jgi:hypothetical protein
VQEALTTQFNMADNNGLLKFNDHELPENFVSIAVQVKEEDLTLAHAAILIRHENINYLHHFPGSQPPEVIENFNDSGWHIYKIIESFNVNDASEVGSFLQYCKRICSQSKITYSYIGDGSSYSDKGEYISKMNLPEFGTCVGFCINTLTNAIIDIEDSFLKLDDWDDSEIIEWVDAWSKKQVDQKYPNLDWTLYNAFKKRITPLEFLCTSFFNKYPINKNQIDGIKEKVMDSIHLIYKN